MTIQQLRLQIHTLLLHADALEAKGINDLALDYREIVLDFITERLEIEAEA